MKFNFPLRQYALAVYYGADKRVNRLVPTAEFGLGRRACCRRHVLARPFINTARRRMPTLVVPPRVMAQRHSLLPGEWQRNSPALSKRFNCTSIRGSQRRPVRKVGAVW